MSGWSTVGLADRSAVEKLTELIEQLREENGRSFQENTEELHMLIAERSNFLNSTQSQATIALNKRMDEMQEYMSVRMDGMARMLCNMITSCEAQSETELAKTRTILGKGISDLDASLKKSNQDQKKSHDDLSHTVSTGIEGMNTAFSELDAASKQIRTDIRNTASSQANAQTTMQSSLNSISNSLSEQHKELKEQIADSLLQITDNEKTIAESSTGIIIKSNKDLIQQVESYCISALEQVKRTSDDYRKMTIDEEEHLEEIRRLSDEMLQLGENQRQVMKHLSQLCQDSDQFMEIQKSINDIWEIMKAVWVHSLLDDFSKEIGSDNC